MLRRRIFSILTIFLLVTTGISFGISTSSFAAAPPASIAVTSTPYAQLPTSDNQSYAGQMASDPAGNLYIGNSRTCDVYVVSAANPLATPTSLPNTSGDWCGENERSYGLDYAHINGTSVLIETSISATGVFEIPLNGISAPFKVATRNGGANLSYNAATDTLVSLSFEGNFYVYPSFSQCTTAAPCTGSEITVTGGTSNFWGIALSGSTIYVPSDSNLFGTAPLTGGALALHGTPSGFNTFATDSAGNVFEMDPQGDFWEIPAGTASAIPLTFATPLPDNAVGDNYAMTCSNGSLYALNNTSAPLITKISGPLLMSDSCATDEFSTTGLPSTGNNLTRSLVLGLGLLSLGCLIVGTRRRAHRA
jgi:hypothetical protein